MGAVGDRGLDDVGAQDRTGTAPLVIRGSAGLVERDAVPGDEVPLGRDDGAVGVADLGGSHVAALESDARCGAEASPRAEEPRCLAPSAVVQLCERVERAGVVVGNDPFDGGARPHQPLPGAADRAAHPAGSGRHVLVDGRGQRRVRRCDPVDLVRAERVRQPSVGRQAVQVDQPRSGPAQPREHGVEYVVVASSGGEHVEVVRCQIALSDTPHPFDRGGPPPDPVDLDGESADERVAIPAAQERRRPGTGVLDPPRAQERARLRLCGDERVPVGPVVAEGVRDLDAKRCSHASRSVARPAAGCEFRARQ